MRHSSILRTNITVLLCLKSNDWVYVNSTVGYFRHVTLRLPLPFNPPTSSSRINLFVNPSIFLLSRHLGSERININA